MDKLSIGSTASCPPQTGWSWRIFALFLALTLTVWLWPSIFGGKVLLPLDILSHSPPNVPLDDEPVRNGLIGDMICENYTWQLFQRRALAAGELPLWNPYTFCGHPLYTTGQASTFYPLNAIFWTVPLPQAYVVFTWVHLFLGGLFTYLFCRRMGIGGFGAAVGGIAFAMGGFLTTRLLWPMLLGSAIWLPLMLLWIDWMAEPAPLARWTRGLLVGAFLFVLPILAGFFEIAFYAYVACGVFTLFRVARLLRRPEDQVAGEPEDAGTAGRQDAGTQGTGDGRARKAGLFLLKVGVTPVLAALLAAPQLLPFFEVMDRNVRSGRGDFNTVKASALAPVDLLTLVSPDALGNPAEHVNFSLPERQWHEAAPVYFGPKNYVEAGFYFGLLPLGFLLLGLAGRYRGFVYAWFLLGLALAFALVTPAYKLFFHVVPGAEQVRTPFRWMYLVLFAGAFLAGMGGQYWYDRLGRPVGRAGRTIVGLALFGCLAVATAVVVLLFYPGPLLDWAGRLVEAQGRVGAAFKSPGDLAGFIWLNGFRFALFALAAAICIALGWWKPWPAQTARWISLAALTLMALDLGQASFGFYTHADPAILEQRTPAIEHMASDPGLFRIGRYGPEKFLYANLPSIYGLQDFGGYDSIILTDYVRFLEAIEHQHLVKFNIVMTIERPASLDSPLLPLLNIRYLLTGRTLDHPDWQPVPVEANVKLYRVRPERELPRAFLVSSVRPVGSLDEAIHEIKSGAVNVFTAATVEAPPEVAEKLVDSADGEKGTARITRYQFSRVCIETSTARRALLVLLDVHYPGWKAYIDGAPAEVYRTNGVFRGVSVPAGRHEVEFRFEPGSFRTGVVIAAGCLVLLTVLGVTGRWRGPAGPEFTSVADSSCGASLTTENEAGEASAFREEGDGGV
ncbi:MAG TPA: YfhO family protein [Phycisphaerae bacterium]|nr:YfhO family protein [Phycisphaerae bacterium]HOL27078.1 YfhO family protein [Phycisphaerae bacterium]HPP21210.1 YfhO family protein [Phycisphaerae bacterium]HPU32783.1 YfhO family protein [Phycisphaerae bacterium]HQE42195.1 YfhO family protein [Phycisphaerae bacterium]